MNKSDIFILPFVCNSIIFHFLLPLFNFNLWNSGTTDEEGRRQTQISNYWRVKLTAQGNMEGRNVNK